MIEDLLPTVWRRSELPLRRAEDHSFFALQREMNRMFDDFFRGFDLMPFGDGRNLSLFIPPVDIREDEKEVKIQVELPGMEEKDIDVTVSESALTIRGERKDKREDKGEHYWQKEMNYGSFSRVIPLPEGVDTEKVDARFKNGILTVALPWLEEAKKRVKKIAVKAN